MTLFPICLGLVLSFLISPRFSLLILDIAEGSLNEFFSLYRRILPTLEGYLVEDGAPNFKRYVDALIYVLTAFSLCDFDCVNCV